MPTLKSRVRLPYGLKLMMASITLGAIVAGGLSWVLRGLMESMYLDSIGTSLGIAAAVGTADMPVDQIEKACIERSDLDAGTAKAVREQLAQLLKHVMKELPADWTSTSGRVDTRILIVRRATQADQGVILASSDQMGEGQPYFFAEDAAPNERWTNLTYQSVIATDFRGSHLGGRCPIRNASGEVIALLVIEIQGSSLEEFVGLVNLSAIVIFAFFMLLIVLLAMVLSWWMARPVRALSDGMDRVADGDLNTRVRTGLRLDEFDTLNRRFNRMVEGLAERERMHTSLSLASDVQARLLPRVQPRISGYEFVKMVRYCEQVGGDYLDCFSLDASQTPDAERACWAVAVGDVSGHGVPAALLMSWTRSLLRGIAPRVEPDPSEMLRVVNGELVRDADGTSFLTLFMGILNPVTHVLRWSSGGHDPGILFRASDGSTVRLASTGLPLGIDEESTFPAGQDISLQPGDMVFVGTDGLSQCRDNQGRYFGFDRIEQLLREGARSPLSECADRIMQAAVAHAAGSAMEDDAAFVIVRRKSLL